MNFNINEIEKPSTGKKRMIALELPEELYQELRKIAFDRELSMSAIVRYACKMLVLDEENKDEGKDN